jgi:hypothetical protein
MTDVSARSNRLAGMVWAVCALLPCTALASGKSTDDWQLQMLLQPTREQLRIETEKDRVFIYSRVKDTDIDRAMDEQFSRLQHMMFVNTLVVQKKRPTAGAPSKPVLIEHDDGCD